MSFYLRQLSAQAEQRRETDEAASAAERDAQRAATRERLRPLDERLRAVLAEYPPELQHEGLSLPDLQLRLKGRHRGNVHPGELGAALRRAGFVRVRSWRDEGDGFNANWQRPLSFSKS